MLGKMIEALKTPGDNLSWAQLAGATVFVITVALMWRQVVAYIMREI